MFFLGGWTGGFGVGVCVCVADLVSCVRRMVPSRGEEEEEEKKKRPKAERV